MSDLECACVKTLTDLGEGPPFPPYSLGKKKEKKLQKEEKPAG